MWTTNVLTNFINYRSSSGSGNSTKEDSTSDHHDTSNTIPYSAMSNDSERRNLSRNFYLPLDLEFDTVSCFCQKRKARRKERDGDANHGDTKLYLEESVLELLKFTSAEFRMMVDLPAGLDYNEWLASYTLSIFEGVNLVYGTISEYCTTHGCQDMNAPGSKTYMWYDEKGKKSRLPAPQYCDFAMTFIQRTVNDENIFPTKYANEFPRDFEAHVRKILRLLFHVIAHVYFAHFREIALLGLHSHLNSTFALLTALNRRYNLIESKETEVLADLEAALHLTEDPAAATTASTTSSTASSSTVSSINNLSNNSCSFTNLNNNSNTLVTQAIVSSPSRGGGSGGTDPSKPSSNCSHIIDGDVVNVIVKQPSSGSPGFMNNNDNNTKDRHGGVNLRNHSPPLNNMTSI